MADIQKLVADLRSIDGRIKAVFDAAKADGRDDLNAAEQRQIKPLVDAFTEKEEELFRAGEQMPDGLFANQSRGRRSEPLDMPTGRAGNGAALVDARPKGDPRLFRNLFPQAPQGTAGWNNEFEFFQAVARKMFDPRLIQNATAGSEGVGTDGGFAVPPAYIARLLDEALGMELIRPRATVLPVGNSNIANVPAWDDLDHSSGDVAGLEGVWLAEGGTATRQTAKIRPLSIRANRCAIYTSITNELLADAPTFMQAFRSKLVEVIAWTLDFSFLRGSGVGQPLGILSSPSLITISADSGQQASTVTYSNIKNIYSRLYPRGRMNAIWIAHMDVLPFLLSMFATDGSTSSLYPVLTQGTTTDFNLLGRPIFFSEHCPQLGSPGDIGLYDLSRYLIVMRQQASVEASNAPGWLSGETDLRVTLRANGQDSWNEPFSPRAGNTLGWAVVCAARS